MLYFTLKIISQDGVFSKHPGGSYITRKVDNIYSDEFSVHEVSAMLGYRDHHRM